MARKPTFSPCVTLRKLFPKARIERLAKETGAMVRKRKVKIDTLFWTLVLGFGIGRVRSLAGLRRAYEKSSGQRLEESSFHDRFTPGLVKMLKLATADALEMSLGVGRALRGHLTAFRDVILTDSTVIRLHDLLQKVYPACRTNHTKAALKAHAIMSVTGAGKQSVTITSERCHDGPVFRVGRWVKDTLLLFDLGYYRFQLFSCIRRNGGFFVSRLKTSANPVQVVVEALLFASLLTLVTSRRLLDAIRQKLNQEAHRLKERRWAAVFESVAQELLAVVIGPLREVRDIERRIALTMLHEAPDSNATRLGLLDSVEAGVHQYRPRAAGTR